MVSQLSPSRGKPVGGVHFVLQLLAVTGIVLSLLVAVAGLVLAVADRGTTLIWLRRVLDGWVIAGSLLTVGWVLLLHRADRSGDAFGSLQDLGRVVTDILVFGLLVALRYALKRPERTSTTVGALALVALSASDMLRILMPAPGTWYGIPCAAACSITGLVLIAVAPWLAGGTSVVDVGQHLMPVVGVVAAFVPVAVCALALAVHTMVGGHTGMALMVLAGSLLVALGIRQGVIHADHLRITHEATTREAHYRTLVDGTCDVITIVSPDGGVRYVSPAAYHVFGYRPEDLLGAGLPLYCHPDDVMPLMQAVEALRQEAASGIRSPGRRVSCRVRHADGRWRHVESTVSHHTEGMIFSSRDVTERLALQEQLEHLAFHDALTGLPNRALFADRVAHALRKRTTRTAPPTVLFVDLDGFKAVNDSAGHAVGDALLVHAARRLQASVRAEDTVARLGGDEFAALLEGEAGTHPPQARDVAERILSALAQPYEIAGKEALVSASIGMTVARPGVTPDELLNQADKAIYEAKRAGKARIRMHIPQPRQNRNSSSPEAQRAAIPLQASDESAAQDLPPAHQGDCQDRSAARPCVPAAGSAMGNQYNGQSQTQALQHATTGDHPTEHPQCGGTAVPQQQDG
ncbi:diguanylate cyclase (GGDEF)-like protein/PAS domain S-box-containing protein [Streptomyces canus]|uniref:sensor domain-containing diguanylate cyclase n=1 Tax=Streptomyces canus TaxID=58343 RepID=UPI00278B0634|nr:sensor domain-containing diguanylate cyclase [Streptomyces canus]MDQ0596018.1 diguanylate cyclase (GGDEF)-like protein/PAS domain S-box-containing protein [Streptomyces canus]